MKLAGFEIVIAELEVDHPHLKETLLTAMGNVDRTRLLDPQYLELEVGAEEEAGLFPILS